MIDSKSKFVLKILAKECGNDSFKIVEISDIIMAMPKHFRADDVSIRHIITYLERQGMISIKYDEDDVFCLAVLPYGMEVLETEPNAKLEKRKTNVFWCLAASFFLNFLGTVLAIVICHFLLKII